MNTTTITKTPKLRLAEMLAPSLGEDKATDLVKTTSREIGIISDTIDQEEALKILEKLSTTPGLVGIVSRLAKVRVRLEWK